MGKNFCVFGITEGMKLEEVESFLRKRGYSEYKSWNEDTGYHKAGVVVSLKAIDGKVEHLSVGVVSFTTYIDVVLSSEI